MKEEMVFPKEHAEFLTVTCLEWKHVLQGDKFKDIITASLTYLAKSNRVYVYGFVIMPNHFHLIWQMVGDYKRANV
jgi:putative transposase